MFCSEPGRAVTAIHPAQDQWQAEQLRMAATRLRELWPNESAA